MEFKNLDERIEFLRQNPIFWSRFGFEKENGDWEKHAQHAKRHKALYDKGIVAHSSIIPVGWIAPDTYDYTETDRLFEMLFSTAPDIVFLPRIKLNVPAGWCAAHPEDVFVYAGGPRTVDEISKLIDTDVHGSHPWRATDVLAQQSFSSKQWISDACEALRRFLIHMESSKWADRIIGYHIAYGTSGETTQWATWDMNPYHKGDYGVSATKAFIEYAKARGKEYDDLPPIEERFYVEGEPVENNRYHVGTPTLDRLFYHTKEDDRCVIYSEFTRDSNMDAVETFCKVVKDIVPQKVAGVFHGYIAEANNCANMQHTGFDRILSSPYVDFISAPKGYIRVGPTEPGLGQGVPNSVNRKKLWLDELDNRTHLCTQITRPKHDYPAKNFAQTRGVYWREFTKNIVFHQGYWWMDLGGGWLDSEEIQDEVRLLNDTAKKLYLERDGHKSVAEVLLVIDENVMHHMRPNYDLHDATIGYTGSTVKECGVPVDMYRTADLEEIDLSQYKLIIFLNAFYADIGRLQEILRTASADCRVMWNYTAGIIDKSDGSFGLDNVKRLTGFSVGEYPIEGTEEHPSNCFPMIYVNEDEGVLPLSRYADGRVRMASVKDTDGRVHILNAMPSDVTVEEMRTVIEDAGAHAYAPVHCVVHADNRFVYVLSERNAHVQITLKERVNCRNEFTGETFENVDKVELDMDEGTGAFIKILG